MLETDEHFPPYRLNSTGGTTLFRRSSLVISAPLLWSVVGLPVHVRAMAPTYAEPTVDGVITGRYGTPVASRVSVDM